MSKKGNGPNDSVHQNSIESLMSNTDKTEKNSLRQNSNSAPSIKTINKPMQKRAVVVVHQPQHKTAIITKEVPKISLPVPDLTSLNTQTSPRQTPQIIQSQFTAPKVPTFTDFQQIQPQINMPNQRSPQVKQVNLTPTVYQYQPQSNFIPIPQISPIQNITQMQSISASQPQQLTTQVTTPHNYNIIIPQNFSTAPQTFFTAQSSSQQISSITQIQRQPQIQIIHPLHSPQIHIHPHSHIQVSSPNSTPTVTSQTLSSPKTAQITTYNPTIPTPTTITVTQQQPRIPLPHPVVSMPQINQYVVQPPEPVYYNDKKAGRYGIRCVCGDGRNDTGLILCDLCNFWLHTKCVNVARVSENESYYCPFCRGQRIRCSCDNPKNYESSIVQCTVCKFWQHKDCENLDYGFIPKDFVCSFCQPNKTYDIPFHQLFPQDVNLQKDFNVMCTAEKRESIMGVNEGHFKEMIMQDLSRHEISFCETMSKYFHEFATLLFDRIHEFWKIYVETFSQLFEVDRKLVLAAIDSLANKLIYNPSFKVVYPQIENFFSETVVPMIANLPLAKLEKTPEEVKIVMKGGRLYAKEPVEDNQYMLDIPGFLEHSDEVKADNGIPYSCISVTNKEFVVDVNGSIVPQLANIRRSFHFNCIVKMIKVQGEVKVALYATRPTGPLSDEKGRRGPAIQVDQELVLPLDGYIPFNTRKVEWKEKKVKAKVHYTTQPLPQTHQPTHISTRSNRSTAHIDVSPPPIPVNPVIPTPTTTITTRSRNSGGSMSPPPPLPMTRDKKKKKQLSQEKKKKGPEVDVKLSLLSAFSYDIIPPIPIKIMDENEEQTQQSKDKKSKKRSRHTSD